MTERDPGLYYLNSTMITRNHDRSYHLDGPIPQLHHRLCKISSTYHLTKSQILLPLFGAYILIATQNPQITARRCRPRPVLNQSLRPRGSRLDCVLLLVNCRAHLPHPRVPLRPSRVNRPPTCINPPHYHKKLLPVH